MHKAYKMMMTPRIYTAIVTADVPLEVDLLCFWPGYFNSLACQLMILFVQGALKTDVRGNKIVAFIRFLVMYHCIISQLGLDLRYFSIHNFCNMANLDEQLVCMEIF